MALPSWAAEYNTDSTPTAAEVQALHDNASDGDTIVMPAGSFDWTGQVNITKEVSIIGAGPGLTTLSRSSGGILFSVRAGNLTCGFFHVLMGTNSVRAFDLNNIAQDIRGLRLTNIWFEHTETSAFSCRDVFYNATAPYVLAILIDHCVFDWPQPNEPLFMHGDSSGWSKDAPFGSADQIYVEDCRFEAKGYPDWNSSATVVMRYNTVMQGSKFDWHGLASNPPYGCRSGEIYGNVWTTSANTAHIEIRGGCAMIWGNFKNHPTFGHIYITEYGRTTTDYPAFQANYTGVSNNGGNAQFMGLPADWVSKNIKVGKGVAHIGASAGAKYPDFNYGDYLVTAKGSTDFTLDIAYNGNDTGIFGQIQTPDSRPIKHQTGTGKNGQNGEEPAYLFKNTRVGAGKWLWTDRSAPATGEDLFGAPYSDKDISVPDEDVFEEVSGFDGSTGVGIGTKADMLAITGMTKSVGFWVTDEGNWHVGKPGNSGQLYVWDGDSWELYYTPYQYPHPLNDGVSEFLPTAPIALSISAK